MNYLTLLDHPSGIFEGQVVDVCTFIEKEFEVRVRLIAFVSLKRYFSDRRTIRTLYPRAWVVPAFPGTRNWRMNLFAFCLLCLFLRDKGVLARGVAATYLALRARKWGFLRKVGYDGRGAWHAELQEFEVTNLEKLKIQSFGLEKKAVLESTFRLGVSEELVRYWRATFGYQGNEHIVVPCTLNSAFPRLPDEARLAELRAGRSYLPGDILLIYSGSTAGWQALQQVDEMLSEMLRNDPRLKVLFLARLNSGELKCFREFPGRVSADWVSPAEVPGLLALADYGILFREQNITNKVASPTKFAEYLCCGLPVLISENLGDYSAFVRDHSCGVLIFPGDCPRLDPIPYHRKKSISELGFHTFTKSVYKEQYRRIVDAL